MKLTLTPLQSRVLAIALLLAVLIFRPHGLFSQVRVKKV